MPAGAHRDVPALAPAGLAARPGCLPVAGVAAAASFAGGVGDAVGLGLAHALP
jgi:hypothetical protein